MECGNEGCKNLVNINKFEPATCDQYCKEQGSICVGAWEEDKNTCEIEATAECYTDFDEEFGGTSDAICECTPVGVYNPPETCDDFGSVKFECPGTGGCRNLVSINQFDPPTCNKYCASQYAVCVGAWEDEKNKCEIEETAECNTDFGKEFGGTSDAICKCTPEEPPEGMCDDFDDVNFECPGRGGCRNLVKIKQYDPPTCNEYCKEQDTFCVGAWEDKKNNCEIKETADCNTDFDEEFNGTSDAICECAPS